jgi:uncharacterized DUF497 family protein
VAEFGVEGRTGPGNGLDPWRRFIPADFEYDFERDKLAAHDVTFEEAAECFFLDFEVRRNKTYGDRYQLIGRTVGGRKLKIIFQIKPGNIVRIITGCRYEFESEKQDETVRRRN